MPRRRVPSSNEDFRLHLLTACLESVLAQEGAEFEMIIFDDASGDGSWEIIKVFDFGGSGSEVRRAVSGSFEDESTPNRA